MDNIRSCCYCKSTEKELRPYGPNGADVCFECAMETPERMKTANEMFTKLLQGISGTAVIGLDIGPVPLTILLDETHKVL